MIINYFFMCYTFPIFTFFKIIFSYNDFFLIFTFQIMKLRQLTNFRIMIENNLQQFNLFNITLNVVYKKKSKF